MLLQPEAIVQFEDQLVGLKSKTVFDIFSHVVVIDDEKITFGSKGPAKTGIGSD